jgi:ERCC4-type nuclease
MPILVDTNAGEDRVFARLQATVEGVVARQRLDVGDVEVRSGEASIVVERKTWADLAASICDGRFHEQKLRMVDERAQYVYVVEGELCDWQGALRGMSHKCLWAALVKTAMRDRKPVFHTHTSEDTADLCAYLHAQLEKGGFVGAEDGGTKVAAGVQKRKRENLTEPSAVLRAMLVAGVPGMSVAKAERVVQAYPTAAALCAAPAADLAALPCGARKLGPQLAKALKNVFADKKEDDESS